MLRFLLLQRLVDQRFTSLILSESTKWSQAAFWLLPSFLSSPTVFSIPGFLFIDQAQVWKSFSYLIIRLFSHGAGRYLFVREHGSASGRVCLCFHDAGIVSTVLSSLTLGFFDTSYCLSFDMVLFYLAFCFSQDIEWSLVSWEYSFLTYGLEESCYCTSHKMLHKWEHTFTSQFVYHNRRLPPIIASNKPDVSCLSYSVLGVLECREIGYDDPGPVLASSSLVEAQPAKGVNEGDLSVADDLPARDKSSREHRGLYTRRHEVHSEIGLPVVRLVFWLLRPWRKFCNFKIRCTASKAIRKGRISTCSRAIGSFCVQFRQ